MQDDQPDDDEATSEGILVFTGSRPALAPGDRVEVSGNVNEFRGGCEPTPCADEQQRVRQPDDHRARPRDGLPRRARPTRSSRRSSAPAATSRRCGSIEDDALGNVEIGNVLFDPEEDGLDWHESLEGMLVEIAAPEVVGLRTTLRRAPRRSPTARPACAPRAAAS